MKPYITLITLGVTDLQKSFDFYKDLLGFPSKDGITGDVAFFELENIRLSLYPKELLAKDAGVSREGSGFGGITLAHNVGSEEEVNQLTKTLKEKGIQVIKEPQKTSWGGYHAYFIDLDGYLWEIAYNPFWK